MSDLLKKIKRAIDVAINGTYYVNWACTRQLKTVYVPGCKTSYYGMQIGTLMIVICRKKEY